MHAIHDRFNRDIRDRLKLAAMGLGLVRLLQDAGLTEEARNTLASLERGSGEKAPQPTRIRRNAKAAGKSFLLTA